MIDFGNNTIEGYNHRGLYSGNNVLPSITYSTGLVENYYKFGDYGGPFVELDASFGPIGMGRCCNPHNNELAKATCVTFSTPASGTSCSFGYDYYESAWSIGGNQSVAPGIMTMAQAFISAASGAGGGNWLTSNRQMTR